MSELDQFNALTGASKFQHIDDLVDLLDAADFWDENWLTTVDRVAKKTKIRSLIKQSKDESGWPLWASVMVEPQDGEPYRLYQQELFMDKADFRQVIQSHIFLAQHHMARAEGYRDRMIKRGGEQMTLPWE